MSRSTPATRDLDSGTRTSTEANRISAAQPSTPSNEAMQSKQRSQDGQPSVSKSQPHYTVFVRLPFQRGDFDDPPPVEWDGVKDKALWKLISKASNPRALDWQEMSDRFDVTLPFLLQQAAWLYEQHFEGMRAQMKRLGASGGTNTPVGPAPLQSEAMVRLPSATNSGGVAMQRTGSAESKRPSSLSIRKNSPLPAGELGSAPATPRSPRPEYSRTPSTTTVTQSRVFTASARQSLKSSTGQQRRLSQQPPPLDSSQGDDDAALGHDGPSDSGSEDEPSAKLMRSKYMNKPAAQKAGSAGEVKNDTDDSPGGFLPFAASGKMGRDDPSATLRNSPKRPSATPRLPSTSKDKTADFPTDSSTSSASSNQQPPTGNVPPDAATRPGPLSPRYRAELEKMSPRYMKSGSEGSPSMGSSFSDLDDASVTQSALEDALLSNIQNGGSIGMGSRMSSLREALGKK